jgi:hypothetical protein
MRTALSIKNAASGHKGTGGGTSFATGGRAVGSTAGYSATLHGIEQIVPLSTKYRAEGIANWKAAGEELGMLGGGGLNMPINVNGIGLSAAQVADVARAKVYSVLIEAGV